MQYNIIGDPLPVVECSLQPGESMITERGSMAWMTPNFTMQTSGGGSMGKAIGRMFSGEAIFQNIYTAQGSPGLISFASSFPGSIRAVQITPQMPIVCQKGAFLASEPGVELAVHFQRNVGAGLFGGEGFIMQRLSGQGMAFIEVDGHAVEYTLQPGQSMLVSTGHLAMMEASCTVDLQQVQGLKNMFLGGEGLFNTVVTGPGRIVLQTMPIPGFAGALAPYLATGK